MQEGAGLPVLWGEMLDTNHDSIIELQANLAHLRGDIAELKSTIQALVAEMKAERKEHSERFRIVETRQAVLYTRWRLFVALGAIVGGIGGIVAIVQALT